MHLFPILNVVGALLMLIGGVQLFPLLTALFSGEQDWQVFLYSGAGAFLLGGGLFFFSRSGKEISEKDGFAVVTLGWLMAAAAGAMPYYLSGVTAGFTDAFFESMSGFTTTGASVFTEYRGIGQGIFLWRSMTQWFGGMGIIVLALVILPALGIGGMQLFKREVPGPYSEKMTPRLKDTARALWGVYLGMTIVESLVLVAMGMAPLEAINHALTTVSTGGFSTRGGSIGEYNSAAIEWVLILFMVIAGMNFALHYRALAQHTHRNAHWRDLEWRWFMGVVVLVSLAVSIYLYFHEGYALSRALTKGTFQVVSILTTTGFGSDDYVLWGAFPQLALLLLMIVGGCAGSTSGGVKWVRIILVFNFIRQEMLRLVHPKVVIHTRIGHIRVTQDIVGNILAFIFLYLTTLGVATLLLSLDGHSILTSLGAAASAIGNIGPGLDAVGPAGNYAALSSWSKWVLISAMLLGRLELMTVFVLFSPRLWRK